MWYTSNDDAEDDSNIDPHTQQPQPSDVEAAIVETKPTISPLILQAKKVVVSATFEEKRDVKADFENDDNEGLPSWIADLLLSAEGLVTRNAGIKTRRQCCRLFLAIVLLTLLSSYLSLVNSTHYRANTPGMILDIVFSALGVLASLMYIPPILRLSGCTPREVDLATSRAAYAVCKLAALVGATTSVGVFVVSVHQYHPIQALVTGTLHAIAAFSALLVSRIGRTAPVGSSAVVDRQYEVSPRLGCRCTVLSFLPRGATALKHMGRQLLRGYSQGVGAREVVIAAFVGGAVSVANVVISGYADDATTRSIGVVSGIVGILAPIFALIPACTVLRLQTMQRRVDAEHGLRPFLATLLVLYMMCVATIAVFQVMAGSFGGLCFELETMCYWLMPALLSGAITHLVAAAMSFFFVVRQLAPTLVEGAPNGAGEVKEGSDERRVLVHEGDAPNLQRLRELLETQDARLASLSEEQKSILALIASSNETIGPS